MFGGKNQYFERKKQLLAEQKIGNSFGLPTQKQISGKQPKQRKECMLFNHPRAHVSALSIKEARTFSKFVYHLKIPFG